MINKVEVPGIPSGSDVVNWVVEFALNNPRPIAVMIITLVVIMAVNHFGDAVVGIVGKSKVFMGLLVIGLVIAGYVKLDS